VVNVTAIRAKRKIAADKLFPPPSAQWVSLARDRWVRYPIGDAGIRRLQELLATPPRVRMPCMLIYGVSGAGKSMLLEKFQRDHAQICERRSGRRMIVATQLPPVPLLRSLYAEIVRSMNADVSPSMRLHQLECTAIDMLAHASPRMLLIDEIQHLLSCSAREQRAALNAIKYLANKLRVSIVAAGTHEALHVMRSDPQIASRFEQLELPIWTESQELRRFIAGYLALLPLKKAAAEIDKRFVEYLLELSDGVTGRIIDILRRAALQGIIDKTQKVGLQQLQYVGAHMPAAIGQRS
jgi:Cdc6-like AAA superfamily ATPase